MICMAQRIYDEAAVKAAGEGSSMWNVPEQDFMTIRANWARRLGLAAQGRWVDEETLHFSDNSALYFDSHIDVDVIENLDSGDGCPSGNTGNFLQTPALSNKGSNHE